MTNEKKDKKESGIAESFLGEIPVLGNLFKELGKTEVFKERFKEVDEKIQENLRKGHPRKWGFESNVSVRPLINQVKKETSELSVHEDYFYGRKSNRLTLAVKVPQEKVSWKIEGKNVLIEADNFEKEIELPDYYREIKKKQYQEGILVLELTK